jgi:hypothetical protein
MATPDRWPPWIEVISANNAVTVNTLAAAAVPGVTLTFTPHINTRVGFVMDADVECTVFAAGSFLSVRATCTPAAVTPASPNPRSVTFIPTAAGIRLTQSMSGFWDLLKDTTYTLAMEGILLVAVGSTYVIRSTRTGLALTAMPNLHS